MNITKESVDALNAVVKVDIVADDYQAKVEEILQDYRKKANIPGFRKGQVPMGLIKKQYGKAVLVDEVNLDPVTIASHRTSMDCNRAREQWN